MKNHKNFAKKQQLAQKETTQTIKGKGKKGGSTVTEMQDRVLGGFSKVLNSRLDEPTLLQSLVAKKSLKVKSVETVEFAGVGAISLSTEEREKISSKNIAEIEKLDDKSIPKRKETGQFKKSIPVPTTYSTLQNSKIEIGETVVINGRTFRKTK